MSSVYFLFHSPFKYLNALKKIIPSSNIFSFILWPPLTRRWATCMTGWLVYCRFCHTYHMTEVLKAQMRCWFYGERGGVVLSSGKGGAATPLEKPESWACGLACTGRQAVCPRQQEGRELEEVLWAGGSGICPRKELYFFSHISTRPLLRLQNFALGNMRDLRLENWRCGLIRCYSWLLCPKKKKEARNLV